MRVGQNKLVDNLRESSWEFVEVEFDAFFNLFGTVR